MGSPWRALVLGSFAISIAAIEVVLRFVDVGYSPVKIDVRGKTTDWRFQHAFKDGHFEFDPLQIWRPKRGARVFNDLGYRGREVDPDPVEGGLRILAVGDSNTLGWGSEDIDWPSFVEKEPSATGFETTMINGGVWGHSSYQGLARLEELLAYSPDIVLVSYGANDAHRVFVSDEEYVSRVASSPARTYLYSWGIGRLILRAMDRLESRSQESDDPPSRARVTVTEDDANLTKMVERARAHGARIYLLTRPYTGESPNELWWKVFAPDYVEGTHRVVHATGAGVIDIQAEFDGRDAFFEDESHFHEAGHRRAARLIAARLAADFSEGASGSPDSGYKKPR